MAQGFLHKDDLRRLTGAARANAQEEFLKAQGIPYKRHGTEVLVLWVHVQGWMEGKSRPPVGRINWAAL